MHNGDGQPASNLGAGRLHVPPFAWPPFAAAVGDPSAFFGLGVGPAQLAVPATSAAPSSDSQLALGLDIEGQPRKARGALWRKLPDERLLSGGARPAVGLSDAACSVGRCMRARALAVVRGARHQLGGAWLEKAKALFG